MQARTIPEAVAAKYAGLKMRFEGIDPTWERRTERDLAAALKD